MTHSDNAGSDNNLGLWIFVAVLLVASAAFIGVRFVAFASEWSGTAPSNDESARADRPDQRCPNGCPDGDGDSVIDRLDACPKTAGSAETDGCPDSDDDGVADADDRCPETAGDKEYSGCALPPEFSPIYFDFRSDKLDDQARTRLAEIAEALKERKRLRLKMIGHTDKSGSEQANWNLAKSRVRAAQNYLVEKHGIAAERLTIKAHGETDPQVESDSRNRKNRRVEFQLTLSDAGK